MPKNIDPRYNPKTTISGGLFMLLGISLFLCPYFSYVHDAIKWTLSVVGFGLFFVPDTILDVFSSFVRKKGDNM